MYEQRIYRKISWTILKKRKIICCSPLSDAFNHILLFFESFGRAPDARRLEQVGASGDKINCCDVGGKMPIFTAFFNGDHIDDGKGYNS